MSPDKTPAPAAKDAPPPTRNDDRLASGDVLVIGILMASAFTVLLNEMLLGVALLTLLTDLDITPTTGQWLTTGYLLTLAILIPATGFLLRRFTGADTVRLSVWKWRTGSIALYERFDFTATVSWEDRDQLICMEYTGT
ncbi:hypothetical protein ACH4L7_01335 [Streptomyces anulatus]